MLQCCGRCIASIASQITWRGNPPQNTPPNINNCTNNLLKLASDRNKPQELGASRNKSQGKQKAPKLMQPSNFGTPGPPPFEADLAIVALKTILPALLQKLVGDYFLDFFGWEIWRTHRTKAKKCRGNSRSIFRKKIRSSIKIFRAKFTLQTRHLKKTRRNDQKTKAFFDGPCSVSLRHRLRSPKVQFLGPTNQAPIPHSLSSNVAPKNLPHPCTLLPTLLSHHRTNSTPVAKAVANFFLSRICKRCRQKGVSLICSDLFWKQIGNKSEENGGNGNKSEQIGAFPKRPGAQIGTDRKKTRKSEQIGTNRGNPLLPTPNWGLRFFSTPNKQMAVEILWRYRSYQNDLALLISGKYWAIYGLIPIGRGKWA